MDSSRSAVVHIGSRSRYRADFRSLAAQRIRAARDSLSLDRAEFAALLSDMLGWGVTEVALARWEKGAMPPGDVILALDAMQQADPILPPGSLLEPVPCGFPAAALAGPWVTAYEFSHAGTPHYHADIATITAESDRQIRAVNHPPLPRTQGRARPFRNEIEARLAGRHLVGDWKNVSDARYFGSVHLAILPGEMAMEGWYTGLASDIGVSIGRWKWVRLDPVPPPAVLAAASLRDPAALYEQLLSHQADAPLALGDIGEET